MLWKSVELCLRRWIGFHRQREEGKIAWKHMQNHARGEMIFSFILCLSSWMFSHLKKKTSHWQATGEAWVFLLFLLVGQDHFQLICRPKLQFAHFYALLFPFVLVYNCFCPLWAQLLILGPDLKVVLQPLFCCSSFCILQVLLFL